MISARVTRSLNKATYTLLVTGHAGGMNGGPISGDLTAEWAQERVLCCCAVSSFVCTLQTWIAKRSSGAQKLAEDGDGYVMCTIKADDEEAVVALKFVIHGLQEIQENYPEQIELYVERSLRN